MLERNYDGRKFKVPTRDGTNLDCMFIPFNDEAVLTKSEVKAKVLTQSNEDLEKGKPLLKYLDYPTIIIFNPNA